MKYTHRMDWHEAGRHGMTTAIWWVRRDLRLADNQALAAALDGPSG